MVRKIDDAGISPPGGSDAPESETQLVSQRLRNLIDLAIAIGRQEGLIGNHKEETEPGMSANGLSVTTRHTKAGEAVLPGVSQQ